MTDLRTIARTAAGIFGGTPRVVKFYDESEEHSVEILSCTPSPEPGLTSYSTIGMSAFDNDTTIGPRQLRVEVVGIAADSTTAFSGGLSSCAFNLAHDRFQIQPKRVFPRVFEATGKTSRRRTRSSGIRSDGRATSNPSSTTRPISSG
ncbi:hypothetical protein [Frondihabitans sp. VKM Ac-2883]|uniref:suppressor of fused domain protein n=1 Tax=Frondihabitans sp. VKM Ac-2883 TaxID=2783823 RepID=UPI00351C8B2A